MVQSIRDLVRKRAVVKTQITISLQKIELPSVPTDAITSVHDIVTKLVAKLRS